MISPRKQIIELIEKGTIQVENINEALKLTKVAPDAIAWKKFMDHLLLWLGGMALSFSAMFFVAYNWSDLGRFAKFGMAEALLALAIFAYWKFGENKVVGKVSLLSATILLGVLLALVGQTYQTGADPWQLFFYWALFMLPWAVLGRFAAIWLVWLALLVVSILLYQDDLRGRFWGSVNPETVANMLIFFLITTTLAIWEYLSPRLVWLSERWAIRLLAATSGFTITWLAMESIFDGKGAFAIITILIWIVWLFALIVFYLKIKPDLFMLTGGCLSAIVVLTSFFGNLMLSDWSAGGWLFLALLVIGMGAGAAFWLKNVHRKWAHESN
ncbi:MAG: DUF2157 domain-containing protein [Leptospirales bacterium]